MSSSAKVERQTSAATPAIRFVPYTRDLEPMVKSFNSRLRDGGFSWNYSESHVGRYPRRDDTPIFEESFLAVDAGAVRGGYHLKHQNFTLNGQVQDVTFLQFPVSEGLIDPKYKALGILLLRDALRRNPLSLTAGGGGVRQPLPRLLKASGWTTYEVPFFFKVIHAGPFFSNISYLRSRPSYRMLLNLLRYTGLGHVGIKLARFQELQPDPSLEVLQVSEFGSWADELWRECAGGFSFAAVRDAVSLNTLFPPSENRYLRLGFVRRGRPLGWVLVLATQMQDHKQFGNMKVGSIIDCLALQDEIPAVTSAASAFLERAGVDLIVTNQSNRIWCDALRQCGFRRGPSNVALGLSPKLAMTLGHGAESLDAFHINRADGDIPVRL